MHLRMPSRDERGPEIDDGGQEGGDVVVA